MTETIDVEKVIANLPDDFPKENIMNPDDPNGFACKGCGMNCCNDKQILISPPEYIRITWALLKDESVKNHALRNGSFASIHIGSTSGLPVMMIQNTALFPNSEKELGLYCPFFKSVSKQSEHAMPSAGSLGGCGIYHSRPGVCRIYPYGTVRNIETSEIILYTKVEHCNGFEPLTPGEIVGAKYSPPGDETVSEWVEAQRPAEMTEEVTAFHKKVYGPFMTAGLHANKDGLMNTTVGEDTLTKLFYSTTHTPPDNPADEHQVIMDWIERIAELKDQLLEAYQHIERIKQYERP